LEAKIKEFANSNSAHDPLVFLDPDICLWGCCEDFECEGVIAGSGVSSYFENPNRLVMPRLHTSFLWIPDAANLWEEIRKIRVQHFDFHPFVPFSFRMDGLWYRYDTGASLFSAIPDKVSVFGEEFLKLYDHIYSGSHLDWVLPLFNGGARRLLTQIHELARAGNLQALRGIRERQNEAWREAGWLPAIHSASGVRFASGVDTTETERRKSHDPGNE
jgi:hypothetical protein